VIFRLQRPKLLSKIHSITEANTYIWELIIKHIHNIHFGTRDSYTYINFAIDIKGSSILSLYFRIRE